MALGNYANLKAAVSDWMARSDLAGNVPDWIRLAEARLNRVLNSVETDAALTGVPGSRRIDISSLSMVAPVALFLIEIAASDERLLTKKSDGTFPYLATPGIPRFWAIDGTYIDFDRPCDQAYSFRFRFRQRFALSDSVPTNWLLTNYPDAYLAATLVWGGGFTRGFEDAAAFKVMLDEAIPEIRNIIAQSKRAVAGVDPALSSIGRRDHYDGLR